MGLEICVLKPMDAFDPTLGLGPSSSANSKSVNNDDDVPPEVTHELHRRKALGRPYQAPSVSELMPTRDAHTH